MTRETPVRILRAGESNIGNTATDERKGVFRMSDYKSVLCPLISFQTESNRPIPCKRDGCALWVLEKECCAIRALAAPPEKPMD